MLLASLIIALGAGVAAPAPPSSANPANPASEHEARALFRRAEINFYGGNFQEALENYQRAYQAKPLPGFVFNVAQCYRNLGNFERAGFFYKRYLMLERNPARRTQVEALIDEMAAKARIGDSPRLPSALGAFRANGQQAETALDPALLLHAPAPAPAPVYRRGWFWATVGGVVAAGTLTVVILARRDHPADALSPIDGR